MANSVPSTIGNYVIITQQVQEALPSKGNCLYYKGLSPKQAPVFLKCVPLNSISSEKLLSLQLQVSLLKSIFHTHLNPYLETFSTQEHLVIVSSAISATALPDAIKHTGHFSEDLTVKYIEQICRALMELHSQGVAHGNLVPESILLTWEGEVKLVEYGLSGDADPTDDVLQFAEVIKLMVQKSTKKELSENLVDLIKGMEEPKENRLTAEEVLTHPFVLKQRDSKHRRREAKFDIEEKEELVLSPQEPFKSPKTHITKSTLITSSYNSPKQRSNRSSFLAGFDQSDLFENLTTDSELLMDTLETMLTHLQSSPNEKEIFVRCFLNFKEILETSDKPEPVKLTLKIITSVSENSKTTLEKVATTGLLTTVLHYSGDENERESRVEVAYLIAQYFQDESLMKLCLASGGLEALPQLLDVDYEENKDLVLIALDCMKPLCQSYESLRIWSTSGVIERLIMAFASMIQEEGTYLLKTAEMIYEFAKGPKPECMCAHEVLNLLLYSIKDAPDSILVILIQALGYINQDALENAGGIVDLVSFLKRGDKVCEETLKILILLCENSLGRIEQVALAGAVPVLLEIIRCGHAYASLALELISFMPTASEASRFHLRKNKTLKLLVQFLYNDKVVGLLGKWIKMDKYLESEVLEPDTIEALGYRLSQETKLIKWEGILESSHSIRRALYEDVKQRDGNKQVLNLINQIINRADM